MHPPKRDDVDVAYLYAYAGMNLLVDLACTGLFYLKSFFGGSLFEEEEYTPLLSDSEDGDGATISEEKQRDSLKAELEMVALKREHEIWKSRSPDRSGLFGGGGGGRGGVVEEVEEGQSGIEVHDSTRPRGMAHLFRSEKGSATCPDDEKEALIPSSSSTSSAEGTTYEGSASCHSTGGSGQKKNINMLAAFTHVLCDTLRTIAVFLAALVSTLTGLDGDKCDVRPVHL